MFDWMAYRSDEEALRQRRSSLEAELRTIQAEAERLAPLKARREALERELRELAHAEQENRKRVVLPMLKNIQLKTPCKERWDRMTGSEQVRYCGRCDQNVYNLSAMTEWEARAFLDARGRGACVRFLKRPDGTVVTRDCTGGIARRRKRRRIGAAAAILALASGGGATAGVLSSVPGLTEDIGSMPCYSDRACEQESREEHELLGGVEYIEPYAEKGQPSGTGGSK